MKILGLDYGDRRIGVAISDAFGWTAQGLEVIERRGMGMNLDESMSSFVRTKSARSSLVYPRT